MTGIWLRDTGGNDLHVLNSETELGLGGDCRAVVRPIKNTLAFGGEGVLAAAGCCAVASICGSRVIVAIIIRQTRKKIRYISSSAITVTWASEADKLPQRTIAPTSSSRSATSCCKCLAEQILGGSHRGVVR